MVEVEEVHTSCRVGTSTGSGRGGGGGEAVQTGKVEVAVKT